MFFRKSFVIVDRSESGESSEMMTLTVTLYLLSLVVWIGSMIFFSFIGAPSIFKILPPEYASKAVGEIFPKYFPLGYISGIVAFVCTIISGLKTGSWSVFKMLILIAMTALTISNSLVTYPKAHSLKEEMQISESRTDIQQLKEEFQRVHRWSMINNVAVLLLGFVLLFLTARNLQI